MRKLFRKLMCATGNHRAFGIVTKLSSQSDLIACPDCRKRFAINYSARACVPFDREMEKWYEDLWEMFPEQKPQP